MFKVTILANAVPEFAITAILVPIVTLGVRRGLKIPDESDVRREKSSAAGESTTLDKTVSADTTFEGSEKPDDAKNPTGSANLHESEETK